MNAPQEPSNLLAAASEFGGERDRPFNPFRLARTAAAKALVREATLAVEELEVERGLRQRRRRSRDQEVFESTVEALVCDLAHRALSTPDGWLSVPFSKRLLGRQGRYDSAAMGRQLPDVVRRLKGLERPFLELRLGDRFDFDGPRQTTIRAAGTLLSRIEELGLAYPDFVRARTEELIILKEAKDGHFEGGAWIDYCDTDVTRRYRDEMRLINDWLAEADLDVDWTTIHDRPDTTDRVLRRYFNNGSFEEGGRLFGGFWQQMSKQDRHSTLQIDGERVTTLDYSQMNPRLMYASVGIQPPMRDPYVIDGTVGEGRELARISLLLAHSMPPGNAREAGKRMFNAMTYANDALRRMPKGMRSEIGLRKSISLPHMVEAMRQFHGPIAHLFFRGVGLGLMFKESEVLVDVLLALRDRKIVGLPVHDAVVVPRSGLDVVREVMVDTFRRHTEQPIEVHEECPA